MAVVSQGAPLVDLAYLYPVGGRRLQELLKRADCPALHHPLHRLSLLLWIPKVLLCEMMQISVSSALRNPRV